MQKIYIVISKTGTILSRVIGIITGDYYAHASLSLDKELRYMYSFGRLHPYNPFLGGFVHESIDHGTFKRFKNTKALIIEVPVETKDYNTLALIIKDLESNKRRYSYNYIGVALAPFGICYKHKNTYYCSEFVRDVLVKANILNYSIEEIIKPEQFLNIPVKTVIYTGLLSRYSATK